MNMIHDFLHQFKNTFTALSFQHFARVVMGFAQITGSKAVTKVNDCANWSRHHSTSYNFFRKGKWQHQYIAQDLMLWYLRHCKTSEEPLRNYVGMRNTTNVSEPIISQLMIHFDERITRFMS